jgi:Mrp family chromosome partitioning ATPase
VKGARIAVQGSRIEDRGLSAARSSATLPSRTGTHALAAPRGEPVTQSAILDPQSSTDQAATLRRLFAPPLVRVLPVLMPELHCTVRSSWVAKLAQAFARGGERTLLVDAARAQIAAALGLRARFDLAQAWLGDCEPAAALVDAGPQLSILPAARALQLTQARGASLVSELAALGPAVAERGGCDLVLLLLPAAAAAREVVGDALVPTVPSAIELGQTLREIEQVAAATRRIDEADPEHPLPAGAEPRATRTFRLLFLGMDARAAATLAHRLSVSLRAPTRLAGAVQIARDLAPVAQAAGGWPLARLAMTPRAAR